MLLSVLALLIASPLVIFVMHAAAYRALRAAGRRPTAHTSAIAAIGLALVATLAGALWLTRADADPLSRVCGLAYTCAVYGALAVLYLDVVNIAETSLHMHVLLEIAWSDRPSLDGLIARYGAERMVAERLDRLTALGQVRLVDGRYQLADRSALRLARVVDAWRMVLGLPTSPAEAAARTEATGTE